jgi:hypothetical protein
MFVYGYYSRNSFVVSSVCIYLHKCTDGWCCVYTKTRSTLALFSEGAGVLQYLGSVLSLIQQIHCVVM